DDEIVTKVQCDIKGYNVEYIWYQLTSNMINIINHLCDIYHITKMSIKNKKVEELKKPLQQKLEHISNQCNKNLIRI
ncbi:19228_t:CDS:1, partial [Gigaspora margarita]